MMIKREFAACPLDAPVSSGCEAEHPRKAAPFYIADISFERAEQMVRDFHYSRMLPKGSQTNFGAFDDFGNLLAVACYGRCIVNHSPNRPEWFELRRLVRKPGAVLTLSAFVAATLRELKARGIPAVISYADPNENHHGGIYQATNWIYVRTVAPGNSFYRTPTGELIHPRTLYSRYGTSSPTKILRRHPNWRPVRPKAKHRYVMPLCIRNKAALAALKTVELPYPKPATRHSRLRIWSVRALT